MNTNYQLILNFEFYEGIRVIEIHKIKDIKNQKKQP